MEFSLLAALASRPGEVVPHKILLTEAFGDNAVMDATDLNWHIWNMRKLLGDSDKSLIRNRRGVGFLLDVPSSHVEVVDGVAPPSEVDRTPTEPHETQPQSGDDTVEAPQPEIAPGPHERAPRRPRLPVRARDLLVAALVAGVALGGSWYAGYRLSQGQTPVADEATLPHSDPAETPARDAQKEKKKKPQDKTKVGSRRRPNRDRAGAGGSTVVIAGGGTDSGNDAPVEQTSGGTGGGTQGSHDDKPEKEAPPQPPQPDVVLYHLVHPDSGDHFMTTSSAAANEKKAEGYQSSTEGWVFSSSEDGTVAVGLDSGTAYVYGDSGSAPARMSVSPLYKLSKSSDVFYTVSSSAANQAQAQGWSRATAGYVVT